MIRHSLCAWGHRPPNRLFTLVAAAGLLACGEPTDPTATPLPATALAVSPSQISLAAGSSTRITARASNSRGGTVYTPVSWSSANPAIATIRASDGTIDAISSGTTVVTATAGTLSASATVAVRPVDPPFAIAISASVLDLFVGGAGRLSARAVDSGGATTNVALRWSSENPAVATVGATDGVVGAIAAGSTTITVAAGTTKATAVVRVITWHAAFAFTRVTYLGGDGVSDVLAYSSSYEVPHRIARPANITSIGAPAWSPDGSLLALEVSHDFFFCPWLEYSSDIYVLDASVTSSGPWRALTSNGLSKSPSWSPDGKRIAYLKQPALGSATNHIYIVDAAGGLPVRLTNSEGYHSRPSWSPDGARLTYSAYMGESVLSQMFIVNADGSGLTNMTPPGTWDGDPSFSPDGTRIVFISYRDAPGGSQNYGMFIMSLDGGSVTLVTPHVENMSAPAWSPDGQQIMFSMGPALFVVNTDGSALTKLTTPPMDSWDSAPAWRR